MTGPSGNIEFCFPSTFIVPSAQTKLIVSLIGPVIKCLVRHYLVLYIAAIIRPTSW